MIGTNLSFRIVARVLVASTLVAGMAGCHNADKDIDYGDPTRLDQATEQSGIWARFVEPSHTLITDTPNADIVLNAWTDDPPLTLEVRGNHVLLTPELATEEGNIGKDQRFSFPAQLLHGRNEIQAIIRAPEEGLRRTASYVLHYQGDAPGLLITSILAKTGETCPSAAPNQAQHATNASHACVYGRVTASEENALRSLSATVGPETIHHQDPIHTTFVLEVPLQQDRINTVTVRANAEGGETTERTVDIEQNTQAPTLTLLSPSTPQIRIQSSELTLSGEASGSTELDELILFLNDELLLRTPAHSAFEIQAPIPVGTHSLRIELTDIAGNHADTTLDVTRDRIHTLHATQWRGGEALLQLDKDALAELLDEEAQKTLALAEVELRPFLYGAIDAIRNPLKYGSDPNELGQAEFNFYRLLNLSADSADLTGTSLEELADLAYAIGLPTARILAELLGMELDEPALETDLIVDVMLNNLILTHPNAETNDAGDPVLKIRLYDALRNLEPLAERYGPDPNTGHPGIIGGAITAEVLEPGFLMSARAISHLIAFEGINAQKATKDVIYILEGDQVLSLDVDDDDTFSIVGLVDEPVVDVRIALYEDPNFIEVGNDRTAFPDTDRPGAYRGNSQGWNLDPWVLERVVLEITYLRYVDAYADNQYKHELRYNAGSIQNAAVFEWERGWFETETAGGLGTPPAPQYVWDTLLELAQVRLHDGGLAEGDANARFDLKNVPVGVTSDDLVAAIRPELAAQEEQLSEMLLGHSGVAESNADFYFIETLPNDEALFYYRDASDSDNGPTFARPGFFRDAALSERADTTDAIGTSDDTTHRKLRARKGERYYFADKEDDVYRLEIIDVRTQDVDILVSKVDAP